MGAELLVDATIDDGRALLAQLDRDGFAVSVAFWARAAEGSSWQLYIGTDDADAVIHGRAFAAVFQSLRKIPATGLSFLDYKILITSEPAARAAIAARDRRPGRSPVIVHGGRFGDLDPDEVYIYPAGNMMTPRDVLQTVTDLMGRTDRITPSHITLSDGSAFEAIPTGLNARWPRWGSMGEVRVTLREVPSEREREIPVEDVVSIR